MNPYLSLIIPAYNEESRIEKSLDSACTYLTKKDYKFEIIVVDDGSSDQTASVVKNYHNHVSLLVQPHNMGKGAAVRRGMIESSGEIKIFTDADFSTPIHEIEKIIKGISDNYDICIGSRALDPSLIKEHQPFYREFMGKSFNKVVQLMLFKGIKDTQCGFKGFTNYAAGIIFPQARIDGFSFDVEILYLARTAGLTIHQVPVEWYNDERSRVNPVSDSIKMLLELFRIKRLHRDTIFQQLI